MIPDIRIEDYNYPLPDSRIAKYPLSERDASNLLVYQGGRIEKRIFREIPELLPSDSVMVFNDTKVVPARLHFRRSTGAHIEIFCLKPVTPPEYSRVFAECSCCSWLCVIGNAKRWKGDILSLYDVSSPALQEMNLTARLLGREGETGVVEFRWSNGIPFSSVLELAGSVPIPPYLNRNTEDIDVERYQTMYARVRGSVAAPTAGLHFTDEVLQAIKQRGIEEKRVCLHVGSGTFLPVKSSKVSDHPMHREPFVVHVDFLKSLIINKKKIIAVGTTSVRTLESLYYVGVSCIEKGEPEDVGQWVPYIRDYDYSFEESISAIVSYLESNGKEELKVGTRIIIVPGFKFRVVDVLVTNFHQPESTLILLVSAFVGGNWRPIYDFALNNDFRFLSYGDSSLLFREH